MCYNISQEEIDRLSFYQNIIDFQKADFERLESRLEEILNSEPSPLSQVLCSYLFSKSKRLRSHLVFLFANAFSKADTAVISLGAATELIHNATLIHDDVIDDSDLRRGVQTLNYKFDNKLAVIAGDFLLSLALKELLFIKNEEVINIFTSSLTEICKGEIVQYFERGKSISIEEYIEKSRLKTAILFESSLCSLFKILDKDEHMEQISEFATNFGIAFQIRDDLRNVLSEDGAKPYLEDFKNGIYTAPFIYLFSESPELKNASIEEVLDGMKSSTAICSTRLLLQKHIKLAIDSLEFLSDNQYKQNIIELCHYIGEVEEK